MATHHLRTACTRHHLAILACTRHLRAILVAIRKLTLVARRLTHKGVLVQRCVSAAAAATVTAATVIHRARSHGKGDRPAAVHARVARLRSIGSTVSQRRAAAAQPATRTRAETTAAAGESSDFTQADVSQCTWMALVA